MRNNFKREKGRKYNNVIMQYDGIKFDSKKEMQRYVVLKEAETKGVIADLQLQVRYELIPPVTEEYTVQLKTKEKTKTRTLQRAITYTCDFQYYKDGELVVEDVKASVAMLPKEFILKEKLMFALKGIKIKRVFSAKDAI